MDRGEFIRVNKAIISLCGFDNGGAETLARQLSTIDLIPLWKSKIQVENEYTFKNNKELISLLDNLKITEVYFNLPIKKSKFNEKDFLAVQQICDLIHEKDISISFILCNRLDSMSKSYNILLTEYVPYFHRLIILEAHLVNKFPFWLREKIDVLDLNIYNFHNNINVPRKDRLPICITPCRLVALKGITFYLNNRNIILENNNNFYYIWEGADYHLDQNGKLAQVSVSLSSLIDLKTKEIKENLAFKDYPVDLSKLNYDNINIFPRFTDKNHWLNMLAAFYPIYPQTRFNQSNYFKYDGYMDSAIEYSLYELVDMNVPVILFKNFADKIGYKLITVIENLEDLPSKLSEISKLSDIKYNEIINYQRSFFEKYQTNTREKIERYFVE